ncbi:MAG: DUF2214 domain-containing protein [Dichotomicrobium sp.]
MDGLLAALSQSDIATYLRFSRWGYAAVNTTHVFGIALLVGAILPLDLRLMGAWRSVAHRDLARVLIPVAAAGLVIAVTTGFLLFSTRAGEYAGLTVFWIKMALVLLGGASAVVAHLRYGRWLATAGRRQLFRIGALSMMCWLGVLVAGRMIAFSEAS